MVLEAQNRPQTRSTHQMLPLEHPDRIHVAFDDRRLVSNAGLLLPITLAHHLRRHRNLRKTARAAVYSPPAG